MGTEQGFWESDDAYQRRIDESHRQTIEESGQYFQIKMWGEDDDTYRNRIAEQANKVVIEEAGQYAPTRDILSSSKEDYQYRVAKAAEEAKATLIRKAGINAPYQTWDESNASYRGHLSLAANQARAKIQEDARRAGEDEESDSTDDYPTSAPSVYVTPRQASPLPVQKPKPKSEYEQWLESIGDNPNMESLLAQIQALSHCSEFKRAALSKITDQDILVKLYWNTREKVEAGHSSMNQSFCEQVLNQITDAHLRSEILYELQKANYARVLSMTTDELKHIASIGNDHRLSLIAAERLVFLKQHNAVINLTHGSIHHEVQQYARRARRSEQRLEQQEHSLNLIRWLLASPWRWPFAVFLVPAIYIFEVVMHIKSKEE